MLDKLVGILKLRRWYDKPGTQITREMANQLGGWVEWREELAKEHILTDKVQIFDWENVFFDKENSCLRVAGYIPTLGDSIHKGKIAGTTLLWNFPWDFADMSNVGKRLQTVKEKTNTMTINIFMHGHSGNPADLQGVAKRRQEHDLALGIESTQLSLGLMGADGTCLSSKVGEGETPLVQVEEVLSQLTNNLDRFKERVGLVWGHSMQGNTVLQLASKMVFELPNASFDALSPVIYGSKEDVNLPESDKHIRLHAGWRGVVVKLLPLIHEIPEGKVKRRVEEGINRTGIPALVVGYFVRDIAMAAIHFSESMGNPYYLKRVNNMLYKMTDLRKQSGMNKRLHELGKEGRVWITFGRLDMILNWRQMRDYAISEQIPIVELESGHFPKEDEIGAAIGECNPVLENRVGGLVFAV